MRTGRTNSSTRRAAQVLCAFIILSSLVAAQENEGPVRLGVFGAYALARLAVDPIACTTGCPQYTGGTGGGVGIGALVEWRIQAAWGLQLRARYQGVNVTMRTTDNRQSTKDETGAIVPLVREYDLSTRTADVSAEAEGWYRIDRLRFGGGIGVATLAAPSWESSAIVVSPGNVTYDNNRRDTLFFPRETIDSTTGVHASALITVAYEVPITPRWTLMPEARAAIPLTSMRSTSRWTQSLFSAGIAITYGFPMTPAQQPGESPGGRGR